MYTNSKTLVILCVGLPKSSLLDKTLYFYNSSLIWHTVSHVIPSKPPKREYLIVCWFETSISKKDTCVSFYRKYQFVNSCIDSKNHISKKYLYHTYWIMAPSAISEPTIVLMNDHPINLV